MEHRAMENAPFKVGDWLVEPDSLRLLSAGAGRFVRRDAMAVLSSLAKWPNAVISRERLMVNLGQPNGDPFVVLDRAVAELNGILGVDENGELLVVPEGRGFKLRAPVRHLGPMMNGADDNGLTRLRTVHAPTVISLILAISALVLWAVVLLSGGLTNLNGMPRDYATAMSVSEKPGEQRYPALSPDGQRIAFTWRVQGRKNWDVYVQTIGERDLFRITDGLKEESYAAWSRDGKWIAYIRQGSNGAAVYKRPAKGGAKVLLADCPTSARYLDWSSNGRFLTFSADDPASNGPPKIWIYNIANHKARVISQPPIDSLGDEEPRFSPDGHWIAFRRIQADGLHELLLIPAGGGRERKVTQGDWGAIRGFDWSHDGDALICSANRDGRFALWRVSLRGAATERLPYNHEYPTWPRTARENDRLIYKSQFGSLHLDMVTLSGMTTAVFPTGTIDHGGPLETPFSEHWQTVLDGSERFPQLSPDGERLAFVANSSGHFEVWSVGMDGTNLRRHTYFEGDSIGPPAWSPDGSWLVFDVSRLEQTELYRVRVSSDRPQRLTHDPTDERYPRFSQDGDHLYYASNRSGSWQIWRQSLDSLAQMDSTAAQQITSAGGLVAQEGQGGALFFVKPGSTKLWRKSRDGGKEQAVITLPASAWGTWVARPSGIYLLQENPLRLVHVNQQTGTTKTLHQLAEGERARDPSLTISEDERVMIFGHLIGDEDVLISGDQGTRRVRR